MDWVWRHTDLLRRYLLKISIFAANIRTYIHLHFQSQWPLTHIIIKIIIAIIGGTNGIAICRFERMYGIIINFESILATLSLNKTQIIAAIIEHLIVRSDWECQWVVGETVGEVCADEENKISRREEFVQFVLIYLSSRHCCGKYSL